MIGQEIFFYFSPADIICFSFMKNLIAFYSNINSIYRALKKQNLRIWLNSNIEHGRTSVTFSMSCVFYFERSKIATRKQKKRYFCRRYCGLSIISKVVCYISLYDGLLQNWTTHMNHLRIINVIQYVKWPPYQALNIICITFILSLEIMFDFK